MNDIDTNQKLESGLKTRHVAMISLGGVIGAGLFAASGTMIYSAGPAILISYTFSILLLIFVMRMLGEMAVAQPDTGSFATYASKALGRPAGFTVGWLYWWYWALTVGIQATAGGKIAATIFGYQPWIWSFILMIIFTGINLLSSREFAEAEFWLALTKVTAILIFIGLGILAICGVLPHSQVSGISHLTADGGFIPNGFKAVIIATITTSYTFMGSEIVTIAAAETKYPERNISKAITAILRRNTLFFIGSLFVMVSLVSWREFGEEKNKERAFQLTLEKINIPHAAAIMDVIMLIAIASCLNSSLYASSRMLYALSYSGYAGKKISKISSKGTPYLALLLSTLGGIGAVLGGYLLPDKIFKFLLSVAGCIALFIYLFIAVSQIILRKRAIRNKQPLKYKFWLFPYLSYLSIIFILFVIGFMLTEPAERNVALVAICSLIIILGLSIIWNKTANKSKP